MKKTVIIAAIAALALASACSERVDIPELVGENVISLDLVYGEPATRATEGTVGENAVSSVQYFFYNDVEANPIYASEYIQNPTLTDLKYSVTLTAGENGVPDLTTMFMNGECIVYGVFNAAQITAAPLADVKATALANTFAHEGDEAGTSTGSKWIVNLDSDQSFVMAGELALARVSGQAYAAKGTVEMNRVAAKIAVDLKIKKEVTAKDNKVWVPMLGGNQIRLYPQNVAGAAVLGGADATEPTYPDNLDLFTYKEIVYNSEIDSDYVEDDGTYYVIESQQDFYTYPQAFTKGSDDEPFIKVIVPWRGKEGATSQKEIYYKVMLPVDKIEANKYYKLTVVISVLGTEGEPEVTLEPLSALVVNWQGGGNINGTISAPKYLSVERGVKEDFEFYTPTSGTPFAASDPVTLTILEIKQANLTTGSDDYLFQNGNPVASTLNARGLNAATVRNWVKLVGTNYLEFGHLLNSDLTSTQMDVAPYYYTVVLSLPAEIDPRTTAHPYGEYAKTITFVQWPEVYVVQDVNRSPNNNGRVYINGSTSTSTTWGGYNLGGVHPLSGNNSNPNMYVLTISVSNTYTIGDPRSTAVDVPSIGYNNWTSAPRTYANTNGRLSNYHPASGTNTSTMIAPKIRVASSYGKCTVGRSQAEAIRRCAGYQEDGIPAGRWRLPTMAEVKFISTLSALGRIPYLFGYQEGTTSFNSNAYYATANGTIRINNGRKEAEAFSGSTNELSVRCVYDEWFWGDATTSRPVNANTFTWGDRNY
ncbi:MAG: hypothetical protein J6Q22_05425 [Prevotella sp.]|nr:hypothetical protein [Prevotella sp.]